jgi:hypothetical protein
MSTPSIPVTDPLPRGSRVTLARLLEVLAPGDWLRLDQVYRVIAEARQRRRQITKRKNLCRYINMTNSAFSKFEKRVLERFEELRDVLPVVTELLDEDCLPTEGGSIVAAVAAWVARAVRETYFDPDRHDSGCEAPGTIMADRSDTREYI